MSQAPRCIEGGSPSSPNCGPYPTTVEDKEVASHFLGSNRALPLRGLATNEDFILVVGAAHIDVWADYWSSTPGKVHHIGKVKFAVGGTGYNVAVNLAHGCIRSSLLSVLREGKFSSIWIKTRLSEAGVNLSFLQTSSIIPEGGFIAIRGDQELKLEFGVTATGIEVAPLSRELLEKAVESCCLVVADCNLSVEQLALVVETANRHEQPILVAGVSECKARRILRLDEQSRVEVFSLNEEEFSTIEEKSVDDLSSEDVSRICRLVRSRHVVVTRGDKGYVVMEATGRKLVFNAPRVEHCVSSSGAGDALLAGVAAHWHAERTFADWSKAHAVIERYVCRVLEEEGASPGSITNESESLVDFFVAMAKQGNGDIVQRLLFLAGICSGMGGVAGVVSLILYLIWTLAH